MLANTLNDKFREGENPTKHKVVPLGTKNVVTGNGQGKGVNALLGFGFNKGCGVHEDSRDLQRKKITLSLQRNIG